MRIRASHPTRARRLRFAGLATLVVAAPLSLALLAGSASGATTVTNETEFRTAFTNAAETAIVLGANIDLTCGGGGAVTRNSATALTVSGGGFTIHQTCANTPNLVQSGAGALTFDSVTLTGGAAGVLNVGGPVSLTSSHVTNLANAGGGVFGIQAGGNVTMVDSTVSGLDAQGVAMGVDSVTGTASLTRSSVTSVAGSTTGAGVVGGNGATLVDSQISTISGSTASAGLSAGATVTTISGSTISGVTSSGDVAFGAQAGGTFTVTNSLVRAITAGPDDVGIGVLGAIGSNLHLTATTVADIHSGLFAVGVGGDVSLEVVDSAVESIISSGPQAAGIFGGSGSVTVTGTEVDTVTSAGQADGIATNDTVLLTESTVTGVEGPSFTSGVLADVGTIVNSTITGNAGFGVVGGDLTIVYSDIVGNGTTITANSNAAATASIEPLHLDLGVLGTVDIAGADAHVAASDFGQIAGEGTTTLFGTVLAQPVGSFENCVTPITVASAGYNFADDTSCTLTGTGDRQGAGLDPQLAALAFNGGPTQTMAITQSSPLFDAIPAAACQSGPASGVTTDQRREPRPGYTGCDIGAYELQVPAPVEIAPRFTG
ncbi:MAG: choice-of-anchor Q domain-containing protein [Acidimicrobiia bacterium]